MAEVTAVSLPDNLPGTADNIPDNIPATSTTFQPPLRAAAVMGEGIVVASNVDVVEGQAMDEDTTVSLTSLAEQYQDAIEPSTSASKSESGEKSAGGRDQEAIQSTTFEVPSNGRVLRPREPSPATPSSAKIARLNEVVKSALDADGQLRAAVTLNRPELFSERMSDDIVCELPDDFWCCEYIEYGPYLDKLKQRVYLARVTGDDDFGNEVDHLLWEMQEIDIPTATKRTFHDGNGTSSHLCPPHDLCPPPPAALLEEAYRNAYQHIRDFDLPDLDYDSDEDFDSDGEIEWGKSRTHSKRACTRQRGRQAVRVPAPQPEEQGVVVSQGIYLDTQLEGVRRLRKPVSDCSVPATLAPSDIGSAWNKQRVSVTVGGGVVYKDRHSCNEFGVSIGLVMSMAPAPNSQITVHVLQYEFAPVGDMDDYQREYPARLLPHLLLQTGKKQEAIDFQCIRQAVVILPVPFWEEGFAGGCSDFYCVAGHQVGHEGGETIVAPISNSPRVRCVWAQRILGSSGTAPVVDMLRRNLQFRLTHWLDKRSDQESSGIIDAISLENVPSAFVYVALGEKWLDEHPLSSTYKASSRKHELSGTCEDFIPIFGYNIRHTVVSNGTICTLGSSGLMSITEGVGMPEVTLRWGPNRPGTFLVILGGVEVRGPPQPDGSRRILWADRRNATLSRTKQVMTH